MMDISDGLSSELMHICTQSKVGLPSLRGTYSYRLSDGCNGRRIQYEPDTCALNGGEDYELLFTVPIADHEKVAEMEGVKLIGHITKPEWEAAP